MASGRSANGDTAPSSAKAGDGGGGRRGMGMDCGGRLHVRRRRPPQEVRALVVPLFFQSPDQFGFHVLPILFPTRADTYHLAKGGVQALRPTR